MQGRFSTQDKKIDPQHCVVYLCSTLLSSLTVQYWLALHTYHHFYISGLKGSSYIQYSTWADTLRVVWTWSFQFCESLKPDQLEVYKDGSAENTFL